MRAYVATVLVAVLAVVTGARAQLAPEQVHLAAGMTPDLMNVMWVTQYGEVPLGDGASNVQYGLSPTTLTMLQSGSNITFTDGGSEHRNLTVHRATMTGLEALTRYYYRVGNNEDGWSGVFTFVSLPSAGKPKFPLRFGVYGDLGDTNAQSLTHIEDEVQQELFDMIVHVGDFAYDLHDNNGLVGDAFMREIQPIAANVPYMTCPGNHESAYNFLHYTFRFNGQPTNSGTLPTGAGSDVAGQPNNWYFSFNVGNIHFVSFSTEILFDYVSTGMVQQQYAWLEADLQRANANRTAAPWIIAYGHRPQYCSCDGDCGCSAHTVRLGPPGKDCAYANGTYGMDNLFHKYGVDMYLAGHEHNYERMYAVYHNQSMGGSGALVQNPNGTVNIITGSAGCKEQHEPFTLPQPPYTAFRSNTYGYSRMFIHNDTHLEWQQVMTDNGQPKSMMGKVIDHFWLVQDHHGPFQG